MKKYIVSVALIILIIIYINGCGINDSVDLDAIEEIEFVRDMEAGWNLGNSLESVCNDGTYTGLELEMYWENPKTTKAMIDEIKKAGFGTVRIPVTWSNHVDENNIIDQEWLIRVKEVVDYVIDNEMYVIINTHHDSEVWFEPVAENEDTAVKMMEIIWQQIGEYFKEYDNHLLFEGMNEPRWVDSEEEWLGGNDVTGAIVNRLNEVFVNTIRGQGGNNAERYLMVATYGNSVFTDALERMRVPEGENIIVTVHAYIPYDFAMNIDGDKNFDTVYAEHIKNTLEALNKRFVKKGIPVIVGEFGAVDKDNLLQRTKWLEYFVDCAKNYDIGYIWWDEGGHSTSEYGNTSKNVSTYGRFRIFDRYNLTWIFPELRDILTGE